MGYKLVRITEPNQDFEKLVEELDKYLEVTDEDEHNFYDQFNSIEALNTIVIAYTDNRAVGCGAFKEYDATSVEIKRMFVSPSERGTGLARLILKELEHWAKESGYEKCKLETGKRQKEAVKFYQKCQYKIIPLYDQYIGMENSLCFEKQLNDIK
ncbi:MAG: GNAT family N-acetyltransferase [Ekhidna sp.]